MIPVKLAGRKPIVPKERWISLAKKQLKKEYAFVDLEDLSTFVGWITSWETSNQRFSLMLIDTKEQKIEIVIGGDPIGLTELDIEQAREYDAIYSQLTTIARK